MNYAAVGSVLAVLVAIISVPMFLSGGIGLIYNESEAASFALIGLIYASVGGVIYLSLRRSDVTVRVREGFFITTASYFALGLLCALPLILTPAQVAMSFTDAAFESFSGLTTTGATVFTNLDEMPRSILFYRAILQWLGGMGIIVLAVAILPMLGIGGMQLFRAEAPGTIKDTSLKPRIAEAAKSLWLLYLGLTATCAVAYWIAGMSLFDAICHAFTTVAIGGFSNYDASIGFFNEPTIEAVAILFMFLAGLNFTLHYAALVARFDPSAYFRDPEARTYAAVIAAVVVLVAVGLAVEDGISLGSFREIAFQAVSFATTTGYTTANVDAWPLLCPVVLVLASFAGGCVGSTAGGMKIYRIMVVLQQSVREIRRLILPDGIFSVKLGQEVVSGRVIEAVWGFVTMYALLFVCLFTAVVIVSDLDIKSAFSAVAACLNNLGPGLGDVATNYAGLNAATKWLLIIAMVLGRLEIFTLLVLLAPRYWHR
ncbi:MAG: potassium transporter [Gammaproteobacteria bacterium]|nr:potassium transporter [Gammaproteobacteria bacterium]